MKGFVPDKIRIKIIEIDRVSDYFDTFVFYTDGFTELFDKNRKMLGIDRLAALVEKHAASTAEEAVDGIFKESMEWSDGRNSDDMTLVVLKMK